MVVTPPPLDGSIVYHMDVKLVPAPGGRLSSGRRWKTLSAEECGGEWSSCSTAHSFLFI